MKTYSIKRRLITAIVIGSALILSGSAMVLDTMTGSVMQEAFDAALMDKAKSMVALTDQDSKGIEFDLTEDVMPEFSDNEDPQYFELWSEDQTVLARSESLGDDHLPVFSTALNEYDFFDVMLPDGRKGRLVEVLFYPQIDRPDAEDFEEGDTAFLHKEKGRIEDFASRRVTLVVAREREGLQKIRMANRVIIASAMFAVLLAIGLLVKGLVSRGLLPLQQLAFQVKAIDEKSLETRVADSGVQSAELGPIVTQINNLLMRLEDAFRREKHFSSDVAHELRTPLSELRALAEVGMMKRDDPETAQAFFADVKDIAVQMETLVVNLLGLARADANLLKVHGEQIDLPGFLDSAWSGAGNGSFTQRQFENAVPTGTKVRSDPEKLGLIVKNLLNNAASYSPPNSVITATVSKAGERIELRIMNPACGLEQSDIPHMTERFWRKDKSRSDSQHAGLGLALVKVLSDTLGLHLELSLDARNRFIASLGNIEAG